MSTGMEELRVLKAAEAVADEVWKRVSQWPVFPRDTVGKQLVRASDSIGANIAESFGRFHYSEKIQFLYYARGSLFETKYWLNRAQQRALMPELEVEGLSSQLTDLARQLNAFAASLRTQRAANGQRDSGLKEEEGVYLTLEEAAAAPPLFAEAELDWLISNLPSPIPNR